MITIECVEGLPSQYESFLREKYDSFMTNCRYIEIYYKDYVVHYMLVREDDKLIELIIFGNQGNTSICFNSLVDIDEEIITQCSQKLFVKYPLITRIHISVSYKSYSLNKSYLFSNASDYVLRLPATMDEYLADVGASTRKNIRNLQSRLTRDCPAVKYHTKFGSEIGVELISAIIKLNIARMKKKGIVPGSTLADTANVFGFAQHYGFVTYIEINGAIVAGNISFVLNKRVFGFIIAHDDNYSQYNIGRICQLHVIKTAIEKGYASFHFLWGENDYKKRLAAKPLTLFSYYIYREYSFDFFISKHKAIVTRMIYSFRQSKYSKPMRDTIKRYRARSWNAGM